MATTNEDEKILYQEDDDFKKLITSLPREKGWRVPDIYQFQGFWYHSLMLNCFFESQKHFEAQDSDIVLATFPKCGTTWLKALVFTIVNRKKHSPFSQEHPLLTSNPHAIVRSLEFDIFLPNRTPDLSSLTTPGIVATHSNFGLLANSILETKCRIIYLCRNPKDTFISYFHYAKKSRFNYYEGISSIEEGVDMFCKGMIPCGPIWNHVLDYWKASLDSPDKIFFVTYEELQSEPVSMLRRMADFLGYSFSDEEEESGMVDAIVKLCSFEKLSNLKVNVDGKAGYGLEYKHYFRKGGVGDWKNHLTNEMVERMDAVVEEKLQGSGLMEAKAAFSKSNA
ncbi:transferase [Lithospermum erythrorhizon]|uniref:Sulfotransferase n=1 Tax=Lithospermum erythrorhizon TaxID=34254 RepID=A0AAV3Q0L3_LITER